MKLLAMKVPATERDKDATRKRDKRSESARIEIPECVNMDRRLESLVDPVKFLRTYFADRYDLDFGPHHKFIIDTVVSRARNGGRQAVAAPARLRQIGTGQGIASLLDARWFDQIPARGGRNVITG